MEGSEDTAMADKNILLLTVSKDFTVRVGLPPRDPEDNYSKRALTLCKLENITHLSCSPQGELFCVRNGDLYRGPLPSKKDLDWFSLARRVGRHEWDRFRYILFHPSGDLYCVTPNGDVYVGPQPYNEHVPWIYEQAVKVGSKIVFDAMCFDPEGMLYLISNMHGFLKGAPPYDINVMSLFNVIQGRSPTWSRLTHFMSFTPDGCLWCVDKENGNFYCDYPPTPEDQRYIESADYLGWNYNQFKFLAFTQDKTIRNIINFEFLPDEGVKQSEVAEVLETKIYDNRRSSSILKHTFKVEKTIKETSSFSQDHGFTIEMGTEISFTAGIPLIASNETKITLSTSTTHNWNFTKENETSITFSTETLVELKGGKAVRMVASVMKAVMNVPYRARALTMFGSVAEVMGMWYGVSHYNLMVVQEDYDK